MMPPKLEIVLRKSFPRRLHSQIVILSGYAYLKVACHEGVAIST